MAGRKTITQLTAAGTLTGAEEFPIWQSSATRKATLGGVVLTAGLAGGQSIVGPLKLTQNAAALPAPATGTVLQIGQADGTATRVGLDAFATNASIDFRRADTTAAAPSAVQSGDNLGQLTWFGRGATVYSSGSRASIQGIADQTWTDSAHGTRLVFSTTANGTTSPGQRLVIDNAGNLIIGVGGSVGTGLAGGLSMLSGTAPSTSPADTAQIWVSDAAAGDAQVFVRNEAGEVSRLTGRAAVVTSQFDKTSDTALANITGLTRNVEAGKTYAFRAALYTASGSSGGVKAAIAGTATATSVIYECLVFNASALSAQTRATALGTSVGGVTAVTVALMVIEGTIVVNAAGTLTVQFAQNASSGAPSSVLTRSSFKVTQI